VEANRATVGAGLTARPHRFRLPPPQRNRDRVLGWVNSICLLFLIVGVVGARTARMEILAPPPIEDVAPVVIEPLPPPVQTVQEQKQEEPNPDKSEAPRVVVVTPDSPSINFSVPTIGNLVVPNSVAAAPPLAPMQAVAPLRAAPSMLNSTGSGGERPQPPYPRIALEQGQQGSVLLQMTVDDSGAITAIEVKQPSGSQILDHSALDFVRRHWTVPSGKGTRIYEATIIYKLLGNQ
jgi:periplasmic protein TonB